MPEEFYAIRRVDGELMYGEYSWTAAESDYDWDPAQMDGEDADEPIEQAAKFDCEINLKVAKTLGIKVPQSILVQATKVIE